MHCFDAIVGHAPINTERAKIQGLAIIYESDFVIIPLIDENIHHFEIESRIDTVTYSKNVRWDTNTISILVEQLGLKKYAIISANTPDFFGSSYDYGQKLVQGGEINSALRSIGVPKRDGYEFSYLNLDEYRNSEFFYMKSWVKANGQSHIICGEVLYPNYDK